MSEEIDKKAVGQRIKRIRREMGYTLEEFGRIFNTSKTTVYNWENGRNLPNKPNLSEVAFQGQISVDELLYGIYCNWRLNDHDSNSYASECGEIFILTEGTPKDNRLNYCMYCGKQLKETTDEE